MAFKRIRPVASLAGELSVPGDKSISHRSVILGALSDVPCRVDGFLVAEDTLCTLEAFRAMGIAIERDGSSLRITGKGLEGLRAPHDPIWCGNSGTTTRLLMGVLTGHPFPVRLEGDASLSRRPMDRVATPLARMGAHAQAPGRTDGEPLHLPLLFHGTRSVRTLNWKNPVASAQVKSAILLAGLYASGATRVEEPSLSRDHTERMLAASGVKLDRDPNGVTVHGTATVRARAFQVPGDFSSAAFFLAAGLLTSVQGVSVHGVGVNPTRTGFLDIVAAMGGRIDVTGARESGGEPVAALTARRTELRGTRIGGDLIPRAIDEFPIIAVLATQASGVTVISDAAELRVKESDRIARVAQELGRMGAHIQERPDGLVIEGPTPLQGAAVRSHGDHRLAMSLAIAGLIASGETTIEETDCVNTSFPPFWDLLDALYVKP